MVQLRHPQLEAYGYSTPGGLRYSYFYLISRYKVLQSYSLVIRNCVFDLNTLSKPVEKFVRYKPAIRILI